MTDTLKTAPLTFAPSDFADLPEVEDVNESMIMGEVCLSLTTGEDVSAVPSDLTIYTTPEGLPALVEVPGSGSYRLPAERAVLFAWGLHDEDRATVAHKVSAALYHLARFCEMPEAHRSRLGNALEALTHAARSWPAAAPLPQEEAPTMTKNLTLTPSLEGLNPDPAGVESARTFAPFDRPTPLQRVEDFIMSLAFFYQESAQLSQTAGLSAARGVFLFAASGLTAILEDAGAADYETDGPALSAAKEWKSLTLGLMWARSERNKAGQPLTLQEKADFSAALANPHGLPLLPAWASRTADKGEDAGRYGAWAALVHLLEHAPYLEDGETETLLSELLEALAQPSPLKLN